MQSQSYYGRKEDTKVVSGKERKKTEKIDNMIVNLKIFENVLKEIDQL